MAKKAARVPVLGGIAAAQSGSDAPESCVVAGESGDDGTASGNDGAQRGIAAALTAQGPVPDEDVCGSMWKWIPPTAPLDDRS